VSCDVQLPNADAVKMLPTLALTVLLASTVVADVAFDHEFDGLFDKVPEQETDPSREAMRRLFNKYGERNSGRITFEGFEHLLVSLGLGHIVIDDHDVHDHQGDDGEFLSLHDNHEHNVMPSHSDHHEEHAGVVTDHPHDHHGHQRRHERSADVSTVDQMAVNSTDISQVRIQR